MRALFATVLIFGLLFGLAAQDLPMSVALVSRSRSLAAETTSVDSRQELRQSFRSVGAFILVQASVDGKNGAFILDTGAPGLILNQVPDQAAKSAESFAQQATIGESVIDDLVWGPLHQRGVPALVIDLSHFERALGVEIAGMIGYAQLRELAVTIDYPGRALTFLGEDYTENGLGVPLRFRLRGHVPTMQASVAGRRARLGLDTGSGVNMLDDSYRDAAYDSRSTLLPAMVVSGVGAGSEQVERLSLPVTEIARANWIHLPFAFTDLERFRESGLHIDGLLGREWMAQRTITLDYQRSQIFVR